MIQFDSPYLIPIIFMFNLLSVGVGIGAILGEITCDKPERTPRWLLLIVPSLVGMFVILWWPTTYFGG